MPIVINKSWKLATKKGNKKVFKPIILPPIPMPKESKDKAVPKYIASLVSILLDLFKSE